MKDCYLSKVKSMLSSSYLLFKIFVSLQLLLVRSSYHFSRGGGFLKYKKSQRHSIAKIEFLVRKKVTLYWLSSSTQSQWTTMLMLFLLSNTTSLCLNIVSSNVSRHACDAIRINDGLKSLLMMYFDTYTKRVQISQ